MSSKIINIVLVCFFSLYVSNANAGLMKDDIYFDEAGVQWQYVGFYDLVPEDGSYIRPSEMAIEKCNADPACNINELTDIPVFNGIEVATHKFGSLSDNESYAISTNPTWIYDKLQELNINDYVVNHLAWYDAYDTGVGAIGLAENYEEKNDFYNVVGSYSAYVKDRASANTKINYVFKSVTTNVPEPSTLAIFSLALVGLTVRRFKK